MSYPFWTGNQAYNVGDIVNSDPPAANGAFVFRCKVAGTSAANQPNFPSVLFETVVDNTVTWETVSAVYDELYKLEPDAIIELFHLRFTNFAANSAEVLNGGEKINVNGRSTDTWTEENPLFSRWHEWHSCKSLFLMGSLTRLHQWKQTDSKKQVNGALPTTDVAVLPM